MNVNTQTNWDKFKAKLKPVAGFGSTDPLVKVVDLTNNTTVTKTMVPMPKTTNETITCDDLLVSSVFIFNQDSTELNTGKAIASVSVSPENVNKVKVKVSCRSQYYSKYMFYLQQRVPFVL